MIFSLSISFIHYSLFTFAFSSVSILAMSFFKAFPSFTLRVFLPATEKRNVRKASLFSESKVCNSFVLFFVNSLIFIKLMSQRHNFGLQRQFCPRFPQSLASHRIRHAVNLKNNPSGLYRCSISKYISLSFTQFYFGWLFGQWHIWKNAN